MYNVRQQFIVLSAYNLTSKNSPASLIPLSGHDFEHIKLNGMVLQDQNITDLGLSQYFNLEFQR